MNRSPAPASSPARTRLELLLARLSRAYIESLAPMERTLVRGLIQARGWDLDRLASGRGPLAPVSDRSLATLVAAFSDELNMALAPGWASPHEYTEDQLDAAMVELKAALS